MKNSGLIIKIAVGVSAIAVVFSLVTLIRSIVIRSAIVFPVIQLVGSAAIFAVCFLMLRALKANGADEENESDKMNTDGKEATAANEDEAVKSKATRMTRQMKFTKNTIFRNLKNSTDL